MDLELLKLADLIEDMQWDFDRFSTSGQETYDEILVSLNRFLRLYAAARKVKK
ncbi:MAG: hypothetical protein P1U86_22735 [Verrucomicrobiales bacterium]|nr:hypothetical protein [Verrucomicrobiales bacterium]